MAASEALICAYLFEEGGTVREVGWSEIRSWGPGAGFLWVHLDRTAPQAGDWLSKHSGLDAIAVQALLAEETRPRSLTAGESLLLILRGVNLNPGADPGDMVSVRIWADAHRVISVRAKRLLAIQDIRDSIAAGTGPAAPGRWLAMIAARLVERMSPVLDTLEEELDELEEELIEAPAGRIRSKLSGLRRQAIALRRYLAPQRDVMSRISVETLSWLSETDKARLRETADRVTRYVEDLDATRERAAVTQEELVARINDQMNRTMYVLSLVAAVFLPLGFLTGLLGINVGGIPGAENRIAFLLVCAIMAVVAGLELALFRLRKWF